MGNVNLENIAKGETFHITKKSDPKPLQAFMVDSREDIPEEMQESVLFIESMDDVPKGIVTNLRTRKDGSVYRMVPQYGTNEFVEENVVFPQILTQARENKGIYMACDNHMLIKYEPTTELASGIGTWPKTNWATTTYQGENGKYYDKPAVLSAALITDDIPEFAEGGHITKTKDGIEVHTSWGSVSEGKNGEGYLIRYQDDANGLPNLNILTRTEESINSYDVCAPDGRPLMGMKEMDDARVKLEHARQMQSLQNKAADLQGLVEDKGLTTGEGVVDDTQYQ